MLDRKRERVNSGKEGGRETERVDERTKTKSGKKRSK